MASSMYSDVALAADPFAPQRGLYQSMLGGMMTNPYSFNLSPAAQSQMTLGSENLTRQAAAKGFLGSGNLLSELQAYGQQVASADYFKQLDELNILSGATTGSPAAAGTGIANIYSSTLSNQFARDQLAAQQSAAMWSGIGNVAGAVMNSPWGQQAIGSIFSGAGSWLGDMFGGGSSAASLGSMAGSFDLGSLGSGAMDWASSLWSLF